MSKPALEVPVYAAQRKTSGLSEARNKNSPKDPAASQLGVAFPCQALTWCYGRDESLCKNFQSRNVAQEHMYKRASIHAQNTK